MNLKEIEIRLDEIETAIHFLSNRKDSLTALRHNARYFAVMAELAKLDRKIGNTCFAYDDDPLFMWECPLSPLEFCVYNEAEDPAHDCCIFCEEPQERK